MESQISIEEARVLLKSMIEKLHSSNKVIAEELDKNRRLEEALNLLMIFEDFSTPDTLNKEDK
ncbi:hypothetical protein [uncultured Bacteroides sp.]|uniref:hypothetical protein n=1 Tax=uncultured Bacteroides sp. TaxID=162156 RepID=UPI002AA8A946|nr:hypothetical protein [uncultured Bacteroides sp.]